MDKLTTEVPYTHKVVVRHGSKKVTIRANVHRVDNRVFDAALRY